MTEIVTILGYNNGIGGKMEYNGTRCKYGFKRRNGNTYTYPKTKKNCGKKLKEALD